MKNLNRYAEKRIARKQQQTTLAIARVEQYRDRTNRGILVERMDTPLRGYSWGSVEEGSAILSINGNAFWR